MTKYKPIHWLRSGFAFPFLLYRPVAITVMSKYNTCKFHLKSFIFWSCWMIFFSEQVWYIWKLILFSYLITTVLTISLHLCKLYASLLHGWYIWHWDVYTMGKEQMVDFSFASIFLQCSWEEMHMLSCSWKHLLIERHYTILCVRQAFSQG